MSELFISSSLSKISSILILVCFPAEAPVDNELHPDYVPSQNLELADHGEIDDGRKRLERFKRAVRREKEREESDSSVNDEVEVSEEEEESSAVLW